MTPIFQTINQGIAELRVADVYKNVRSYLAIRITPKNLTLSDYYAINKDDSWVTIFGPKAWFCYPRRVADPIRSIKVNYFYGTDVPQENEFSTSNPAFQLYWFNPNDFSVKAPGYTHRLINGDQLIEWKTPKLDRVCRLELNKHGHPETLILTRDQAKYTVFADRFDKEPVVNHQIPLSFDSLGSTERLLADDTSFEDLMKIVNKTKK